MCNLLDSGGSGSSKAKLVPEKALSRNVLDTRSLLQNLKMTRESGDVIHSEYYHCKMSNVDRYLKYMLLLSCASLKVYLMYFHIWLIHKCFTSPSFNSSKIYIQSKIKKKKSARSQRYCVRFKFI